MILCQPWKLQSSSSALTFTVNHYFNVPIGWLRLSATNQYWLTHHLKKHAHPLVCIFLYNKACVCVCVVLSSYLLFSKQLQCMLANIPINTHYFNTNIFKWLEKYTWNYEVGISLGNFFTNSFSPCVCTCMSAYNVL